MGLGILGKKLGMTQIFHEDGSIVPVTVIQAGPCYVVQKKTAEKEGYSAVQLGFGEKKKVNRVNKPITGHFKKANIPPMSFLKEFRVNAEEGDANEVGSQISVEMFEIGEFVDVT